ncbi:RTC4-like domain-containing protein [Scheffersomyces coipomensis]|uniref:RTC4-like domain-containing protein n=1 Tax=Scheffersomyces coipomensis TaxID=1788519 RepID=UPI00315DDA1E
MFGNSSKLKRKSTDDSIFGNKSNSSIFGEDDRKSSSSSERTYKKVKKSKNYYKKNAIQSSPDPKAAKSHNYNRYELTSKSDASDDDFDNGIINISKLQDASVKSKDIKTTKDDHKILEELSDDDDDDDSAAELSHYEGFALKVANGNILEELSKDNSSKIKDVKKEYAKYNFPKLTTSKRKLLKKCEKYMDIIPKILKGKESTSDFYELAKKQRQSSPHETMAVGEKWEIKWKDYYGGYYGFKRQSIIGDAISTRFEKELKSAEKKNKTLSYWTITGFCTYILANELIIRLAMEDLDVNFNKAESIIKKSVEYGIVVSDSREVKDDIDHTTDQAKEFMKEFSPELDDESPDPSPKKSRKDILQVVLEDN